MCSLNPFMPKAATPVPGPRNPPGPPLNPVAPLPMQVGADEEAAIAARNAQVEAEKMALEGQAQGRQFIDGGAIGREQPSKKGMGGDLDRRQKDASGAQAAQDIYDMNAGQLAARQKAAAEPGRAQAQRDAMAGGMGLDGMQADANAAQRADDAFRSSIDASLNGPAAGAPTNVKTVGSRPRGGAGMRLGDAAAQFAGQQRGQTSGRIVE